MQSQSNSIISSFFLLGKSPEGKSLFTDVFVLRRACKLGRGENLMKVFSRIAYCFSVAGVVREERSKAEKEYFHQLVDAGMCLHICHVAVTCQNCLKIAHGEIEPHLRFISTCKIEPHPPNLFPRARLSPTSQFISTCKIEPHLPIYLHMQD